MYHPLVVGNPLMEPREPQPKILVERDCLELVSIMTEKEFQILKSLQLPILPVSKARAVGKFVQV